MCINRILMMCGALSLSVSLAIKLIGKPFLN